MAGRARRSVFGLLILGLFIGFNLVCLWFFLATREISLDQVRDAGSPTARTVATAIGRATKAVELGIWLLGDAVLGLAVLLTRGSRGSGEPGRNPETNRPSNPAA